MGYTFEQLKKDFPVGTKVVPHSKSAGLPFDSCHHWKEVKNTDHPYLYVVKYDTDCGQNVLILNAKEEIATGNYYRPSDVTVYKEKFIVGEKVKIVSLEKLEEIDDMEDCQIGLTPSMKEKAGTVVTLEEFDESDGTWRIEEDGFWYDERMFEKIKNADKKDTFKIGDKVMLKPYDAVSDHNAINKENWNKHIGKILTIRYASKDTVRLEEDKLDLVWSPDMFTLVDYMLVKPGQILKVGDKVKVISAEKLKALYEDHHSPDIVSEMIARCGKTVTIAKMIGDFKCRIVEDNGSWTWAIDMFEPITTVKEEVKKLSLDLGKLLPVGTKVKVRTDLVCTKYSNLNFVEGMKPLKGKVVTITHAYMSGDGNTRYDVKETHYTWTNEMFESIINQNKEEEETMLKYNATVSRLLTLLKEGEAFYSKNGLSGWYKFGCVIEQAGQRYVITGFKADGCKLTGINAVPFRVQNDELVISDAMTISSSDLSAYKQVDRYGFEYITKIINTTETESTKKTALLSKIKEAELKLAEMKKEVTTM